ncbi:hypothetical protein HW44_12095 [Nitrosococcus oceani]|nr:hypothetical protein HW44_12095 [Nitrosococcus oceani]
MILGDNGKEHAQALQTIIEFIGYRPVLVEQGEQWQETVTDPKAVAAALIGSWSGDKQKIAATIKTLNNEEAQLPVFVLVPKESVSDKESWRLPGALGTLRYPFSQTELTSALQNAELFREGHQQKGQDRRSVELFRSLVGNSRATRTVRHLIEQVADSNATVLILGESGTGKEVVARNLHYHSSRRGNPFVPVNCGAIPENMLEATLFGYEKGAFTGACQARPGKFELAQGGTLLLDEISEMDLGLQAKLLRVLQEREVERLGGGKMIPLDIRILATTNRDLQEQVANGRFREDLYYRLNVFPLCLPPLRERRKDILPLARRLAATRAIENGRVLSRFSLAAEKKLLAHPWPGNIRELDNVIQRAMILADEDELTVQSLVFDAGIWATPILGEARELNKNLKNHEKQFILETLGQCNGRRKQAAVRLGISERTLRYKLARLREAGVVIPDFPSSRLAC